MPTYPLPTLAAQVTSSGCTAPSFNDILLSLIATVESIFGSDIYLTPDTQDYQLLAVVAMGINDTNQTIIATYNNFIPAGSQGAGLSSLVKINGLQRESGSNSTVIVTVVGVVGTQIVDGIVQDTNGNQWVLPTVVVIPLAGQIDVTATCLTVGAVVAAAGTVNKIITGFLGWQSVNNANAANVGIGTETDSALRQRQAKSTALPGITPLQSIIAAVGNIPNVTRYKVYENDTSQPDGNGIPGHSIAVVVKGGDTLVIAQTIEATKNPGTGTFGTITEVVEDPKGLPIAIHFFPLTSQQIFFLIQITALEGYVSTTGDLIISTLIAAVTSLPIGSTAYYNWLLAAASLPGQAVGETFVITGFFMDLFSNPTDTSDIPVTFSSAADTSLPQITLTVS
jgi:uncharacterized phage protein gp47/JayE